MTRDTIPQASWLPALLDETQRLAERIRYFGMRGQARSLTDGAIANQAVEDLAAAVEELTTSHEELRRQSEALALAQGELEQSRRHYQELFDFAPDAYLITDPKGLIQEANHAVSALAGYARTYLRGKPLTVLVHQSAVKAFIEQLARLRLGGASRVWEFETQLKPRRRGAPLQASVRVGPVLDETGALTGLRWLVRDVSADKAQAARLAQMEAEHAEALRTRTMELEAIVRMQAAALAAETAARQQAEAALRVLAPSSGIPESGRAAPRPPAPALPFVVSTDERDSAWMPDSRPPQGSIDAG